MNKENFCTKIKNRYACSIWDNIDLHKTCMFYEPYGALYGALNVPQCQHRFGIKCKSIMAHRDYREHNE